MRIALAQINPIVGDLAGNYRLILNAVQRAREAKADLIVLPELAITGYPPRDLVEKSRFVARNREIVGDLAANAGDMAVIVGFVDENPAPVGRRLFNAAAVIAGGRVLKVIHKSLLPTYDVFDEARYFEPCRRTRPVTVAGHTLGITICEDIWIDEPPKSALVLTGARNGRDRTAQSTAPAGTVHTMEPRLYDVDPPASLVEEGAAFLINIAASPYEMGKPERRRRLMSRVAARFHMPMVAVNQVGGNDELIFDGHSAVFDATGQLRVEAAAFREDFIVVDLDALPVPPTQPSSTEGGGGFDQAAELHDALVLGLRDYCRKCGFRRALVGMSGGVDSSVVAALASEALGPDCVTGVAMPGPFSAPESRAYAEREGRALGIHFHTIPIVGVYEAYLEALKERFAGYAFDVAEENLQARIRGNILMALSNKFGDLVLSPGNKSELATGYCTLYGDMSGGLAVISDVVKVNVYAVARYINREREIIPPEVLRRPPTAELRANQTDQDTLPPYEVLDPIIQLYVEDSLSAEDIIARGHDERTVRAVVRMIDRNEYKRRQAAPGLRVTSKAFGVGRRMPIAARYEY